jgi:hypothetical protein
MPKSQFPGHLPVYEMPHQHMYQTKTIHHSPHEHDHDHDEHNNDERSESPAAVCSINDPK